MDEDKKRRLEAAGWTVGSAEEFLGKCEENEFGPPTIWDDAWFTMHVVSLNYPVRRDPPQFDGQEDLLGYWGMEGRPW